MPDFHREWIDNGLIEAPDFNVNILMNPPHYRIDNLPMPDKEAVIAKYNEHIDYLSPLDTLQRATNGYKSAINFIEQPSIPALLEEFKELTNKMDTIRNESFNKTFPEFSFNDD
jgi:tRNA1(Val) A37 N6-methylase TrmN6